MSENGMEGQLPSFGGFQNIKETVRSDAVLELFQRGELLVRVMDPPIITRGAGGPELEMDSWEEELDFMNGEAGMAHTSTTLIMQGKAIALYHKPFGFLIDATKVGVEHVASADSGSRTISGELKANRTDLHTLSDLRDRYKDEYGVQEMNEVNATVHRQDIVGLVIRAGVTSPTTKAGLEVVRSRLRNKGLDLPVYEYDERKGTMTSYINPDKDDLLSSIIPILQPAYKNAM